jgi:DNA ligase (NAD+)
MLSLGNAFDADEDRDRIRGPHAAFLKLGDDEPVAVTAEPKIDGLSISLRYENGQLVVGRPAATAKPARTLPGICETIGDIPQHRDRRRLSVRVRGAWRNIYVSQGLRRT